MARGDFGADRRDGESRSHFLHTLLLKDPEKISGQRLGTHSMRICPHDSVCPQKHPRRCSEKGGNELLKKLFFGSGGGTPEADEGHDFRLGAGTNIIPNIYRKQEQRLRWLVESRTRRRGSKFPVGGIDARQA